MEPPIPMKGGGACLVDLYSLLTKCPRQKG